MTSKTGDADDPIVSLDAYVSNGLNQYPEVTAYSPFVKKKITYDADGNLSQAFAVGDIDGDGDVDIGDLSLLNSHLGDTRSNTTLSDAEFTRADYNGDDELSFFEDFVPLLSGYGANEIGSYVGYTWDAENRLTRVEPLARNATTGAIDASLRKLEFGYDYMGRRIEKRVYKRDSSNNANWGSNPIERRRFVWNGWLMLREAIEIDANGDGDFVDTGDSTRTKTYTWGRDLGGSLESAGGIGGLLAVSDDNSTTSGSDDLAYVYCYDANGNVGQLVNWAATGSGVPSGALVAKYEYDAYGNVTASGGTYATANTYRFSTKPRDDETGLGYWGYRYYDPRLGRWLSRDPSEEQGGWNLYQSASNSPARQIDALGLLSLAPWPIHDPHAIGPDPLCPPGSCCEVANAAYPRPQRALIGEFPVELLGPAAVGPAVRCLTVEECVAAGGRTFLSAAGAFFCALSMTPEAHAPTIPQPAVYRICPDPVPPAPPPPPPPPQSPKCLPCVPPVGTVGYRTDNPPSRPHRGIPPPHTHYFVVQQSPPSAGCRCFWHRLEPLFHGGDKPLPGAIPMGDGQVGGGGIAP